MPAESLRVMTFNLWHGGDAGKQPLEQSVRVVEAARADIVGFQETIGIASAGATAGDNGTRIAEKLGWHYLVQSPGKGIASRFPIVSSTPSKIGATLSLPSGRTVTLFNVHLMYTPYQPYQLLGIPYGDAPFITTEAEAIREALAARGEQVRELLAEIEEAAKGSNKDDSFFVTGDFNEPSHLDWTAESQAAGHCPVKVEWPSTKMLADAGFQDAYRAINPDPVRKRGLTWTPTTALSDPKDHHDRIDFVLFRGHGVSAKVAEIVGESRVYADTVVELYPSDHRAVVCEFSLR
ncbi:MAG: endonuclease/exonuclease/phosphatase family protein [Armatimonas sp.]